MDAEETGEGGEVAEDPQPLTQLKLLKKAAPTQGGREADAGTQAGERNTGTPEGEVMRGCFQVGRSSKASSLVTYMDSKSSKGWSCCGLSATGGPGEQNLTLTVVYIACNSSSATQGRYIRKPY